MLVIDTDAAAAVSTPGPSGNSRTITATAESFARPEGDTANNSIDRSEMNLQEQAEASLESRDDMDTHH